jgi:hypothetical protein
MMKIAGLILLLAATPAAAGPDPGFGLAWRLEAGAAYVRPADSVFREVYGGGIAFGGEVGATLSKAFGLWAGMDYFKKDGQLTETKEETAITIIPLCAGVSLCLPGGRVSPYLRVGAGYFFYKETSVIGTVKKGKLGFVGRAGVILGIAGPLFLDIQASYESCKVKPEDVEADLGGLKGRLALGLKF